MCVWVVRHSVTGMMSDGKLKTVVTLFELKRSVLWI